MSIPYAALQEHYRALSSHHPDLLSRFFTVLLIRHPQATEAFQGQDASLLARSLHDTLLEYVEHLGDPAWLRERLTPLGPTHLEQGITRQMYAWFGEALLITLRHASGEAWTPEISQGWLQTYDMLCSLLHEGTQAPNGETHLLRLGSRTRCAAPPRATS